MQKCSISKDHKRFVVDRVPVVRLRVGRVFMLEAETPVCNTLFGALFGVSKNAIDADKGTPQARASFKVERRLIYILPQSGGNLYMPPFMNAVQ